MNNKRAIYLLVVFGILFLTLIGYLTYLEIFHGEEYRESAYNPRNYEIEKNVLRGSIYDRNSVLLAYSEKTTIEKEETVNGNTQIVKQNKFVRQYPYKNLYSHVIGYVSDDYSNRTLLENAYNADLIDEGLISKISREIKNKETKGKDIYLTIDHELQKVANSALGNRKGAVIAMNPKTGEILAMVSKPDFDPSKDTIDIDSLEDTALYSRAIQMTYPPGSVYKIITSVAGIENGLEDEIYEDTDGVYVIESKDGNEKNDFRCQNVNKKAYGTTNLDSAFTVSSNVYFCHIGSTLSTSNVQDTASKFLFNKDIKKELGFDLPVTKSQFQKGKMTEAERAIASIGQGQTEMTPLHMALMASAIANDGVMPEPYIVSKVGISERVGKLNSGIRVTTSETSNKIKDMMLSCVESGTGTAAKITGVKVCGKTGSSENSVTAKGGADSNKTHAVFVGFAPYDDPEICVCVVIEHAGYGGTYAAPVARQVMNKYING